MLKVSWICFESFVRAFGAWIRVRDRGSQEVSGNKFSSPSLKYSVTSPWRVDPDNVQVAEVDALFVVPAATGAAFGPDVARMRRLNWQLRLV